MAPIFREPDLSTRPYRLDVQRQMPHPPATLYKAWTTEFDRWFAAPGSVLMTGQVDTPFFFETEFQHDQEPGLQRHPHYGRFLQLVPDQLIQLTWLTGAHGTKGAETIVTVELIPNVVGTLVRLSHAGFSDVDSMEGHRQAWPMVLEQLEKRYTVSRDLL
ncbi:MAG TPA: SRPBCC domain-containing protein [Puia sp.]|jgi:uncharacterized protein YndB with AHSA1/START domain|nr:SRPBCC domain-containing protein [Puia sp.]